MYVLNDWYSEERFEIIAKCNGHSNGNFINNLYFMLTKIIEKGCFHFYSLKWKLHSSILMLLQIVK